MKPAVFGFLPRYFAVVFVMSLPACSYFDTGEPVTGTQVIDVTNEGEGIAADLREDITVLSGDLGAPVNYNSSVEVFPLDGYAPQSSNQPTLAAPQVEPFDAYVFDDTAIEQVELAPSAPRDDAPVVITFDHGSSALDRGDMRILEDVVTGYGGEKLWVTGHASTDSMISDPIARKISNLKLSMDRAYSAARVLIDGGVPSDALLVSGAGEVKVDDPARARRVEIFYDDVTQ